jgi:hypothetical protein
MVGQADNYFAAVNYHYTDTFDSHARRFDVPSDSTSCTLLRDRIPLVASGSLAASGPAASGLSLSGRICSDTRYFDPDAALSDNPHSLKISRRTEFPTAECIFDYYHTTNIPH